MISEHRGSYNFEKRVHEHKTFHIGEDYLRKLIESALRQVPNLGINCEEYLVEVEGRFAQSRFGKILRMNTQRATDIDVYVSLLTRDSSYLFETLSNFGNFPYLAPQIEEIDSKKSDVKELRVHIPFNSIEDLIKGITLVPQAKLSNIKRERVRVLRDFQQKRFYTGHRLSFNQLESLCAKVKGE